MLRKPLCRCEVNHRFDIVDTFFYISRMLVVWFCLGREDVTVSALRQGHRGTSEHGVLKTKGEGMPIPIRRDEVQRLVREEAAQLVEVLPPPEYEGEHIEGAINIPLKELDGETTSGLDKDRPVIVY